MKKLLLLSIALVASFSVMAAECVIVPRPLSYEPQKGKLSLTSKTVVYAADKALVRPATMFCSYVAAEKDLKISVAEGTPKSKGAIVLLMRRSISSM